MNRMWSDQPTRTDLPSVADDVRRMRVAITRRWPRVAKLFGVAATAARPYALGVEDAQTEEVTA
ncbi:hypothetical protein PSD17_56460 [Pseudonocardia sp. D17]|nr:hypothetical protein PSD17_56460 [Pseudonocardia sp. D17]